MSARRAKPRPNRKLVLVDLENLVGCSPLAATNQMWSCAMDALFREVPITDNDPVIIAVNPMLAFRCREIAPHTLMRWGKGPNGADLRLIKELEGRSLHPTQIHRGGHRLR